jgi:[acyl-carrier-protein] S-malonyltransferase
MAVIGYLFTAAGYQYVNLGKKAYDSTWLVRQYYDKVEKKYPDFKINKLSFLGPQEELSREENGIIVNGVYQRGVFDLLKEYKVTPEQIMGFKSGEIMALACAEAISFEDAIDFLFKKREIILEEVGRDFFHHLLINSVPVAQVEKLIGELQNKIHVNIVSYNGNDSVIIIYERKAQQIVIEIFKKLNGNLIDLPNEEYACFSMLKPIAEKLKEYFIKIKMDKPKYRVLCQTTGEYYESVQEIKEKFVDYIFKPARIDLCIENMLKNGVNTFVEIGAGTFLSRMARKRDSGKRILNTNDLGEIQKTIKLAN